MSNLLNKKGVSNIIGTLLIALLSIAAIGILWVYVNNTIKPSLSPQNSCVDFSISSPVNIESACYNASSQNIEIKLLRSFDNTPITELNFVINTGEISRRWSCSNSCGACSILNPGDSKIYYFNSQIQNNSKVFVQSGDCLLSSSNVKETC